MTHHYHCSTSSANSSLQTASQEPAEAHDPATAEVAQNQQLDLALESQALQILESSDDCIKILDLDGRILFMSRAGRVLLGIQDVTSFLHTLWVEVWQGADQQAAIDAIAKAKAGRVCTFQGYCSTLDGEPKWWDVKVSPILGANGSVERLLCISRDITEHRKIENRRNQAEEQLRESEERYRAIVNQAVTGVACTDLDGNLTLVNQKYCDITGYSADELTQLQMQDITHPADLPRNVELFKRMRTEGTPFEIEKRYIRKDGSIVWVNNSVSAICDRYGKPQSTVAIVLDITERKRREANAVFLAEIGEDFSRLATADEIMQTVGAKLGAYLQITTCNFTDVDEAHDRVTVHYGWSSPEVPSTVGTFRTSQYLSKEFERASRAGETVVICNTQTDPRTDAAGYAALNMYSFVTVPFHRNGRWTHYIAICDSKPRNWREDEIKLIEEISNQIFPRLERARTEAALRESEEQFRTLTATIPQLIWTTTPEGNVDYLSDQWADYTGLSPEQLYDWNWQQITHPDDLPNTLQAWQQSLELGEPLEIQHRFRDRTGAWRWQLVRGVPIKDAMGIKKWVGTCTDIQGEVDIKEALYESEERFRLMADAVPQIIWITDAEGRVEFFNKQWSNYTGVDYEPTTAAEIAASFLHPDDGAPTIKAFNQARQTGNIFTIEHRVRAADGAYRWFLVKAEPYRHPETDEIIRWFGASIDIDDRKQAEAAIAADLRDTQLLRDLSARLTTENDIQALYQEIVATAIALTEADAGSVQILDETTQDLVLLATQGATPAMIERFHRVDASSHTSCGIALATGERVFVNFDVPESEDPDGSLRMHVEAGLLSAQSTPLISRAGKSIGMVSTHWRTHHSPSERELRFLDLLARQAADLIEQRQAEAQRKQLLEQEQAAREEAERANRIKDEFLAVLSHELRSPLNPILGWAKLLQSGRLDATKTAQALATIERNAKLQSELIEDLLDVSRILRGKLSLNVAPVNLAFVIRAAMETVRLAAEAKSIQIEVNLAPDVGLVAGDSTRLQQVIWNLLSNAVKFTSAGGRVAVRLETIQLEAVSSSDLKGKDGNGQTSASFLYSSYAQVTITDTGQGIAPDFLPYVFDYFRQANATTTRRFGGLGLGLAIVRHLVELHGGTVSVASLGEGQGSTFTVRLPVMAASLESNQDRQAPQQSLDLSGIKILVVDDEADTRELVAFVLQQQGVQVIVATSAAEALLMLPQAQPDVLLSDIGMPEMDGYMLIRQVRMLAPEQGGRIPAIALTAYAGDTNQQQVLAAGFQKHISKPIEPEELVHAIARLVHEAEPPSITSKIEQK